MGPEHVFYNGKVWLLNLIQNFVFISFIFWKKCHLQLFLSQTILFSVRSSHQVPYRCDNLQKHEFSLCQMEINRYERSHTGSAQIAFSLLLAQTILKKYQSKSKAKNLVVIATKTRWIDSKVHGIVRNWWIIDWDIFICQEDEEKFEQRLWEKKIFRYRVCNYFCNFSIAMRAVLYSWEVGIDSAQMMIIRSDKNKFQQSKTSNIFGNSQWRNIDNQFLLR